jgi:hypothetical protein
LQRVRRPPPTAEQRHHRDRVDPVHRATQLRSDLLGLHGPILPTPGVTPAGDTAARCRRPPSDLLFAAVIVIVVAVIVLAGAGNGRRSPYLGLTLIP